MQKNPKNPGDELFLPTETDLPSLSVKELHSLWRTNESDLMQLASVLDPDQMPLLVVHGSTAERIQNLIKGDSPMMWVFATYERIRNTRELVRNLYCLTSGSSKYSLFANEGRGPIKGEAGIMCFGTENNKQFFDWRGDLYDAWKNSPISDFFPQAMPHSYRLPQLEEQPDDYGYVRENLDDETECRFFDFRKNPSKIMAFDRFVPQKADQRIAILDAETPKYLLRSHDSEPCLDTYRKEILRRLFCQNLAATLINRLRESIESIHR